MAAGGRSSRQWLNTFAAQLLVYAQGIVVFPIVIRVAGEETYGTYVLVITLLGFVFGIWTSGVPFRYRRNLVSAADRAEIRRLFEPQFTFQIVTIGATAIVMTAVASQIEHVLRFQVRIAPWLLGGWLVAQLLYRLVQDFFQFTLRFTQLNLIIGGFPAIYMALLLVAFQQNRITLDILLMLQIAAFFLIVVPFIPRILHEIGIPRLRLPYSTLIEEARFGYPVTGLFALNFVLASSDRYLISFFISIAAVAQYNPAYQLAWSLIFFPTIGHVLFSPSLWRLVDTGARAEAERLVTIFNRTFLTIALPFIVGALMVGPSILGKLATPEIGRAGAWVVPIIAIAAIPYTITSVLTSVAFAVKRTAGVFTSAVVGAVCNLGINVVLLPLFRTIIMSAAAAFAGHAASCLYMIWHLRSNWSVRIEWLELARSAGASGVMALALWGLGFRFGSVAGAEVLDLALAVLWGTITYFAAFCLFGGFRREARRDLVVLLRLGVPQPVSATPSGGSC